MDYTDRIDYEPLGPLGSRNCLNCGAPHMGEDAWCRQCSDNWREMMRAEKEPKPELSLTRAQIHQLISELVDYIDRAKRAGWPRDRWLDKAEQDLAKYKVQLGVL